MSDEVDDLRLRIGRLEHEVREHQRALWNQSSALASIKRSMRNG